MFRYRRRTVRRPTTGWGSRNLFATFDILIKFAAQLPVQRSAPLSFVPEYRSALGGHKLLHCSDKDREWRQGYVSQIDITGSTLIGKERRRMGVVNALRQQMV
jgi:hypothetical protein